MEVRSGRALVADFGIARVNGGGSTGQRQVVGTAEFMSPEQAVGGPVDARSDLYSLGVVGFFALSGRLPFDGPDAMTVLARHVTDPPPPVASLAPGVPERLAEAIDRCLSKDPAARYPSGEAFAVPVPAALARPIAVAGAIVAAPLAVMVARVRRLLQAGFGRRDLTDALRAELFHRREELAFLYGEGPSRLERVSRRVCYLALAISAGVVITLERTPALAARAL